MRIVCFLTTVVLGALLVAPTAAQANGAGAGLGSIHFTSPWSQTPDYQTFVAQGQVTGAWAFFPPTYNDVPTWACTIQGYSYDLVDPQPRKEDSTFGTGRGGLDCGDSTTVSELHIAWDQMVYVRVGSVMVIEGSSQMRIRTYGLTTGTAGVILLRPDNATSQDFDIVCSLVVTAV